MSAPIIDIESNVPKKVQENLLQLLNEHADGVDEIELKKLYLEKFHYNLDYLSYGFFSLEKFILALPAICRRVSSKSGRLKLFCASHAENAAEKRFRESADPRHLSPLIQQNIKDLINRHGEKVDVNQFQALYQEAFGSIIDPLDYGLSNLADLLNYHDNKLFVLIGGDDNYTLMPVPVEEDEPDSYLELIHKHIPRETFPADVISPHEFISPLDWSEEMPVGQPIEVVVTYLERACSTQKVAIFFHLKKNHQKLLMLQDKMEEFYKNHIEEGTIDKLKVEEFAAVSGVFCAAVFRKEGFNRVQISRSFKKGRWCDCYFIDYGNAQKVPFGELRYLGIQFKDFPSQCIAAELHLSSEYHWSPEAVNQLRMLSYFGHEQLIEATVVSQNPPKISLRLNKKDIISTLRAGNWIEKVEKASKINEPRLPPVPEPNMPSLTLHEAARAPSDGQKTDASTRPLSSFPSSPSTDPVDPDSKKTTPPPPKFSSTLASDYVLPESETVHDLKSCGFIRPETPAPPSRSPCLTPVQYSTSGSVAFASPPPQPPPPRASPHCFPLPQVYSNPSTIPNFYIPPVVPPGAFQYPDLMYPQPGFISHPGLPNFPVNCQYYGLPVYNMTRAPPGFQMLLPAPVQSLPAISNFALPPGPPPGYGKSFAQTAVTHYMPWSDPYMPINSQRASSAGSVSNILDTVASGPVTLTPEQTDAAVPSYAAGGSLTSSSLRPALTSEKTDIVVPSYAAGGSTTMSALPANASRISEETIDVLNRNSLDVERGPQTSSSESSVTSTSLTRSPAQKRSYYHIAGGEGMRCPFQETVRNRKPKWYCADPEPPVDLRQPHNIDELDLGSLDGTNSQACSLPSLPDITGDPWDIVHLPIPPSLVARTMRDKDDEDDDKEKVSKQRHFDLKRSDTYEVSEEETINGEKLLRIRLNDTFLVVLDRTATRFVPLEYTDYCVDSVPASLASKIMMVGRLGIGSEKVRLMPIKDLVRYTHTSGLLYGNNIIPRLCVDSWKWRESPAVSALAPLIAA